MTKRIPVLIVGAGPTGLMLGCELARHNIEFRIIDKNSQPALTSNATWVQTRTIEILDEIGILDRFLNKGHKCNVINMYSYGELLSKINLASVHSKFKFVLQLPQSLTEKILNEYLNEFNYKVERPKELITISPIKNGIHTLIGCTNGQIENIECDWLVACDGSSSNVRIESGVLFTETDIPQQFMVADVEMDAALYPNEINIFFDVGTVLAVFPMGGCQFRINANLHTPGERYRFSEKKLKKLIRERTYRKCQVNEVSLSSPYYIHNKLVKNMRHGAIFFAGDAGHVHSPAGGQGMNLGIQDAYNLAWKLALVIKGNVEPSFLDSYHLERYPIAKKTVDHTKLITTASLIENPLLIDIRNLGINILNNQIYSAVNLSDRITQLDFEYKKSPIIDYTGTMNVGSPKQGQHARNVTMHQSIQLYNYLHREYYNVLIFTTPFRPAGWRIDKKELDEIEKLQQLVKDSFSSTVKIHVITDSKSDNFDNMIFDENSSIYRDYQIKESSIYVIRPDKYIAYCSKGIDSENIKQFFQKNLILKNNNAEII